MLATAWHPLLIGSELRYGVVLPLTGIYLAPQDTMGVRVFGPADGFAGTPARQVGEGAFDLGVVPDRSLAPADQVPDVPAVLLVDRPAEALDGGRQAVALPVRTREYGGPPVRRPIGLWIDGAAEADEAKARAVSPALPSLDADPGFGAVFDHAPASPALTVSTAGQAVTIDPDGPGPQPGFRYPAPG